MTKKLKKQLRRILTAVAAFAVLFILEKVGVFERLNDVVNPVGTIVLAVLSAAVCLYGGYDVFWKAIKNIGSGHVFDENFLMSLAVIGAFAVGEYLEGAAVILFYQVGEWFQGYAVGKSRNSISALMKIAPDYANKETEGEIEEVDPDEVHIGDIFVVKPGEKVPLDGTVLTGESFLDTSSLTGESVPRAVREGDAVYSGSINQSGVLRIRADKEYEDSTVSRILEMVENASARKAPVEQFITRFAKVYTPVVTILAFLLGVIPPLFLGIGEWSVWAEWLRRACTFLVISCPCALVISIPLSFFGGIGAASKSGVLIKGSNFLEALAKVRKVAFDKTGTLTRGEFTVTQILPGTSEVSEETVLGLAAALEKYSNHPIAHAILVKATETNMPEISVSETTVREVAGMGIEGETDGAKVLVGNARLLREANLTAPEIETAGTVVYVAKDGAYVGAVLIEDRVKEGVPEGIAEMKKAGITETVMLTGDRTRAAEMVASTLRIDRVKAELLPGDKVAALEEIMDGAVGQTAFIGDGINDAPVLVRADVGIAMGAIGSDAAIEAADIVLMDDDIRKVSKTVKISRKTARIVRQNIVFALGVKFAVLVLGALGLASMWLAMFADVGVAVLAILNAMRALRVPKN